MISFVKVHQGLSFLEPLKSTILTKIFPRGFFFSVVRTILHTGQQTKILIDEY